MIGNIVRVISLVVLVLASALSHVDWKRDGDVGGALGQWLLSRACSVPGLRLTCGGEYPFPLSRLTYWDTILGCFFYALAFTTAAWLTTPLPDVTFDVILMMHTTSRGFGENGHQQDDELVPRWHPAGGEQMPVRL